ncbi:MAG: tRNA pseudouridine(55) synthase TruB [Desulfobacterales bacterium]
MNGIIVIDKPADITSARVVSIVKKTLLAKKVGHAGTLDPFAEGVLICCVNQATRLADFLLHGTKKYIAELKLGEETDTQDLTGTVISSAEPENYSTETIKKVFKAFEGPLEQLPPVYSALKHKGVPLYKLARSGQPVQKPPRRVEIYGITILNIALPLIRFEVLCSAGTYIRTLGADIGKVLGCGGHLNALKRTASSGFTLDQAVSLSALKKLTPGTRQPENFISMADALPEMPTCKADTHLVKKIRHGQKITLRDLAGAGGLDAGPIAGSKIKVVDQTGELVAILNYQEHDQQLNYCCVFAK